MSWGIAADPKSSIANESNVSVRTECNDRIYHNYFFDASLILSMKICVYLEIFGREANNGELR